MSFDFQKDPFSNLLDQIQEAENLGVKEPAAMSLATASKKGVPSVRAVLFKGLSEGGLLFFSNYQSPKGHDLDENPQASLLFYWSTLFRQIRISGQIEKISRDESESYFKTRPRLSQLGAWASQQSQKISSFHDLMKKVEWLDQKYLNSEIPCPEYWGGYRLIPDDFEFWFGREGRLHERYCFEKINSSEKSKSMNSNQDWNRFLRSP